jgi:hypothetical protein
MRFDENIISRLLREEIFVPALRGRHPRHQHDTYRGYNFADVWSCRCQVHRCRRWQHDRQDPRPAETAWQCQSWSIHACQQACQFDPRTGIVQGSYISTSSNATLARQQRSASLPCGLAQRAQGRCITHWTAAQYPLHVRSELWERWKCRPISRTLPLLSLRATLNETVYPTRG